MAASLEEIRCLLRCYHAMLLLLKTNRVQGGAMINRIQREMSISVATEVFRLVGGMDRVANHSCVHN